MASTMPNYPIDNETTVLRHRCRSKSQVMSAHDNIYSCSRINNNLKNNLMNVRLNSPSCSNVRDGVPPFTDFKFDGQTDKDSTSMVKGTAFVEPIWRDMANRTRQEVLRRMDELLRSSLDGMITRAMTNGNALFAADGDNLTDKMIDRRRPTNQVRLPLYLTDPPEKEFRQRDSILTELFEISHIRTVYHVFVAIMIIFSINTMVSDFIERGGIVHTYHLELFIWAFGGLRDVIFAWLIMQTTTLLLPYVGLCTWSSARQRFIDWRNSTPGFDIRHGRRSSVVAAPVVSATTSYPIDWLALAIYVVYQVCFAAIPLLFVFAVDLPPASTAIIVAEQVRMMMKAHAFIRVNAAQVLKTLLPSQLRATSATSCNATPNLSGNVVSVPGRSRISVSTLFRSVSEEAMAKGLSAWRPYFSHYLFFMFAPTLVYRDSYPRSATCRWAYVASNFAQVIASVVYTYYLLARFCFEPFAEFGRRQSATGLTAVASANAATQIPTSHPLDTAFTMSLKHILLASFTCTLPGGLILLITFFAFLHSWFNAFAEMLRFGDRLFYKDWWNSTAFSAWYRTWNVVVHDWLYTYVYRDLLLGLSSFRYGRAVATTAVFLISALVHEYILTMVFRFFYPVLFVYFGGAGFLFFFVKGKARGWNIALWVALFLGMGQLICLYSVEWYARRNCRPVFGRPLLDFWVPHSWFCTRLVMPVAV